MKANGYGRFGGHAGINEFTEVHWVSVEDPGKHYPIWHCCRLSIAKQSRATLTKQH
jgi:hypothetical protein